MKLGLRLTLAAAVALTACQKATVGGMLSHAAVPTIRVSPSQLSMQPGTTATFSATVTGLSNTAVQWSVAESGGGTIDSSGLYQAPTTPNTYHVVARSVASTNLTATATVVVSSGGSGGMPTPDCATTPLRSTGTRYYFCDCQDQAASGCVPGNDANDGQDPSRPRRSFSAALQRFNSMSSGDTVALCRGGSFVGGTEVRANCSPTNPCELRDYAPSWGQGANNPRPIVSDSGTILGLWNGTTGGLRFWNLDLRATSNADGLIQVLNDTHDLDICNVGFTGGYDSLNMAPTGNYLTHIQVRGSQFKDTQFCGFIGGSPGITVTGNSFNNNGLLSEMTMHSAYLIAEIGASPPDGTSANTYTFSNNSIFQGSYCNGVMLVVHGVFRNTRLVVENNDIATDSTSQYCFGVMTSGGYAGAEFHQAVIRRNRIRTQGQTAMEVSCCQDCDVSSNLLVNGGLSVATSACNPGGFMGASATIQNNTLYGDRITVGSVGQSSGYVVENNAVFTDGSNGCLSIAPASQTDNNYCRSAGGVADTTVFLDPTQSDFRPTNPGPLIGTANPSSFSPVALGTVPWSASDAGVTRQAGHVDIGAYQH